MYNCNVYFNIVISRLVIYLDHLMFTYRVVLVDEINWRCLKLVSNHSVLRVINRLFLSLRQDSFQQCCYWHDVSVHTMFQQASAHIQQVTILLIQR